MEHEPRDRYASLFSTKSDKELRAILGWSYTRIRTCRRAWAARKVKRPAEWTLEEDRLPDRVLARMFGRSVGAVRTRRGKKHILLRVWRPEDDKILGTRTDQEVALLLGRSGSNVASRRSKLGIPAKAKPRVWTPPEAALALGIASKNPDYHRWTKEEEALLGTMPDHELAQRLGVSLIALVGHRQRKHIPSIDACRAWTPAEEVLLGTAPDDEVARRSSRTTVAVSLRRRRLRIASFGAKPPGLPAAKVQ